MQVSVLSFGSRCLLKLKTRKIVNNATVNLHLRKVVYLLFTQKSTFVFCVTYVNELSFSKKSNCSLDILGAIYLDAGLEKIDEVLASWLFPDDEVNH